MINYGISQVVRRSIPFLAKQIRSASSVSTKRDVVTVSTRAANQMSKMMRSTTPSNDSILLSVKRRGCNGLSYVMGYPKVPPSKLDEIVPFTDKHNNQGRLIVDKNAVMSVVGTHLDYIESDMGSEFVFRNPNQKGACGCGESFNV